MGGTRLVTRLILLQNGLFCEARVGKVGTPLLPVTAQRHSRL